MTHWLHKFTQVYVFGGLLDNETNVDSIDILDLDTLTISPMMDSSQCPLLTIQQHLF